MGLAQGKRQMCHRACETRVYVARMPRKEKTNKMASEITFVGDEEIQFLSSVTIPNLRQALEENFLDSDSGYEDCTSDSDDGSESILEKSCSEDQCVGHVGRGFPR